MAEYVVTAPNGEKFKITAPEGATDEQVMQFAQQQFQQQARAALEAQRANEPQTTTLTGSPPSQSIGGKMLEAGHMVDVAAGAGFAGLAEGLGQLKDQIKIIANKAAGNPTFEDEFALQERMNAFDRQQQQFRLALTKDAAMLDIDPTMLKAVEIGTQIGADAAVLGAPLSLMKTGLKRVLAEGGAAAFSGAAQPTLTPEDRAVNMLVSGTIGTGIASAVWGGSLFSNLQRGTLATGRVGAVEQAWPKDGLPNFGLEDQYAREGVMLQRMFNRGTDPDWHLTPSMLTGSESISSMERSIPMAPGSARWQELRKLEDGIISRFDEIVEGLNPDKIPLDAAVFRTRQAMEAGHQQLKSFRQAQWNKTMNEVVAATGGSVRKEGTNLVREGGKHVIDGSTFQDTLLSLFRQASKKGQMSPEAEAQIKKFTQRWNSNLHPESGRMTAAHAQELMIELTEEMGGSGPAFSAMGMDRSKAWAKTLMDAVHEDITRTAQSDRISGKAATALMKAREDYKAASMAIEQFESQGLWKMLNKLDMEGEGSWFGRIMKLEPKQMQRFLSYADEAEPGLANAVRGRVLADVFEKNKVFRTVEEGPASDFRVNFSGVVNDLIDEGNFGVSRFDVLAPPDATKEEIQQARNGLKVLVRVLKPDLAGEGMPSVMATRREESINVFAQDMGFIARMLSGQISTVQSEKMLFGKDGFRALMDLGKFNKGGNLKVRSYGQNYGVQTLNQALSAFSAVGTQMLLEEQRQQEQDEREAMMLQMANQTPQMIK